MSLNLLTKDSRTIRKDVIFCIIIFTVYFSMQYLYNYPNVTLAEQMSDSLVSSYQGICPEGQMTP